MHRVTTFNIRPNPHLESCFRFLRGFSSSELTDFFLRLTSFSSFSSLWDFLLLPGLFLRERSRDSSLETQGNEATQRIRKVLCNEIES